MIVPIVGGPSKAEIMDGWVLCDGTNGTPDLRGRFIRMATLGHQQDDIFEYAINERGGSDIPSTSSSNDTQTEIPFSIVNFVMKKAKPPEKIKYGSDISIKTSENLLLYVKKPIFRPT